MSSGLTKGDEDLVVVAKPRSDSLTSVKNEHVKRKTPVSTTKSLEMQMSTLSLSSKKVATKKAKKIKRSKKASASPLTTTQQRNEKVATKKAKKIKRSKKAPASPLTTTHQRNGKSSVGHAGVVYPSPAKSLDIVQVLHVSIT